ncbi:ethanolamine ammonia-lyase [Pelomyxa schiedti]|nr:ethanolamine ammonia-lyase [Pelomyxa schiedti]KAH3757505.1 ethanolamine ammonia-lyase [Pelomyxa schiedti]
MTSEAKTTSTVVTVVPPTVDHAASRPVSAVETTLHLRLKELDRIYVPPPQPDERYSFELFGHTYNFDGLKQLLAAADFAKSGDQGLVIVTHVGREAARQALSGLTLQHIYDHPLLDERGQVDSVMRVNYDLDMDVWPTIRNMTVGQLKDHLLNSDAPEIARVGRGLTGVMIAAVAKLMDIHELICVPKRISFPSKARSTLGVPGTLSARLQPNHQMDDVDGISFLTYVGLSMGVGDCLIGVNPAIDTPDSMSRVLTRLNSIREKFDIPTQICTLGHVRTQLACIERGAPLDILFQSIAGTDRVLSEEFDVTVDLLDSAYYTMLRNAKRTGITKNFMYFETGQGSEMTYGKNNGIDMTTCEALKYGLARRYSPFMVNNVTGFIGPETHKDSMQLIVSSLQDNFCGKVLGLPMGMDPCFTLHSQITIEAQQMATQLCTAAGTAFFMDVYLNSDRMLGYFTTSGHNVQTLREVHALQPAAEFAKWGIKRGIFVEKDGLIKRGPNWGNPRIFCENEEEFQRLKKPTNMLWGLESAGPCPANKVQRTMRANMEIAKEAVFSELNLAKLSAFEFRIIGTQAPSKEKYLGDPILGQKLDPTSRTKLTAESMDIQIVISDGLSAEAIHYNVPIMLPILEETLKASGARLGKLIVARYARVKLIEDLGAILNPKVVVMLVGERPGGGADASRALSAYVAYHITDPETRNAALRHNKGASPSGWEYNVVNSIYSGGQDPESAAEVVSTLVLNMLRLRAGGNRLSALLEAETKAKSSGGGVSGRAEALPPKQETPSASPTPSSTKS